MTRLSGYGGIAFAAVLILGFILDGGIAMTTGGPPQLFASNLSADLTRASTSAVWPIELWTYIIALVPFAMFLVGLRGSFGERDDLTRIAIVMAGLFILFHTIHNTAYAAIVTGLAPTYAAGSAAGVATEQVARGLIAFAETSFLPGGGIGALPLAIALWIFGTQQRRDGARRTGTVALVASALTAFGYVRLVMPEALILPVVLPVTLAGWVGFIAWSALTGRAMLSVSATDSASSRVARSSGAPAM